MYFSRALNMVNNKRALFEVKSPIKVPSKPFSGLVNNSHWLDTVMNWYSLTETGRFTTVLRSCSLRSADPCYWSVCSVIPADIKLSLFWWSFVLIDLVVIVESITHFVKKIQLRTNLLGDSCIKWVSVQNTISSSQK